jgi:hypothetical protein
MTKPPSLILEEIASTMSAAAARALRGLREVSDAIAELREAEMMLKGLAASQVLVEKRSIADEHRKPPSKDENPRLAYPIPEVARKLGLHRRTIEYKIQSARGRRILRKEARHSGELERGA